MSNLFSVYMLCVLAGDLIGHRAMARIPGIWILLGLVVTFAGSCAFQWYAYSRPANYIVSYNYEFAGLFLCCCFLFEGIRRKAHWFRRLQGLVTYLSQISFGIYFVHIMIMECLNWYLDLSMLRRPEKLFFLELVSVGGSILVIALLSRVKVLKKYLFMMKR